MRVAPSVPHTLTRRANNDALLLFLAQKRFAVGEAFFVSHSCILGVARIHAVPSTGTGGLICTQTDGSQAQSRRPAALHNLRSVFPLFYSLIQFRSLSSGRTRKTLTAHRGTQASERSCAHSHSSTCTYITHSGALWDV